jgi:hypothetical protein
MSRFADSPYFLLKDYINLVVAPPQDDILGKDIINVWDEVVFTDVVWIGSENRITTSSPFVDATELYPDYTHAQIFEHDDVQWNAHFDFNPNASYFLEDNELPGVLMRGMEKSIIVDGGQYLDLFAKIDDEENPLFGEYGFAPVRLKPLYEDPREKIYFRFDIVEVQTIVDDPTFTVTYDSEDAGDEPYYDSDYIEYRTFDYRYDGTITNENALLPTTEIYFRKDSAFHEWLKDHANAFYQTQYEVDFIIRNYVNTDKLFIYFGEIYPTDKPTEADPNRYHIIFNGLKDWVNRALPSVNRTENLTEWNDTYFDMVHSEGYQLMKDVWTLRDAQECDEKYLPYIPTFYDIPTYNRLDEYFTPVYREYARDLVQLLKRKGTYASIYVIHDLFCNNNPNILAVYERWHKLTQTIGEVDTEIELTTANFTEDDPDNVMTIDGSKISFNVPSGSADATATLNNIVLDATQDITMHVQLKVNTTVTNSAASRAGLRITDGTNTILEDVWSSLTFGNGNWLFRWFTETAEEGTGQSQDLIFSTPETAYAYINYNATTRVVSFDFDDGGAPEPTVFVTLKESVGDEWHVQFYGTHPTGGGTMGLDVEVLFIDSGTVNSVVDGEVSEYKDYIYTGQYGRVEPTDESVDQYGYLVSDTQFQAITGDPYYIDQNNELIVAQDGKYVAETNLLVSSGVPVTDLQDNVYITRDASTHMLYTVADVTVQPPDTDYDSYGYLYNTISGAYVDDNGDIITYNGIDAIFQSMLLLDAFSNVTVDENDDVYLNFYPEIQKVPLQKALIFPKGAGEFWYDKADTASYPDGYFSTEGDMLSPYYRVDLDVNVEPVTNTKILPRNVSENLYSNWEYMRPVNRQAEYNYIYAPFTDLTGQSWSLYTHPHGGQSVTTALDNVTFDSNNFIYIQRGESDKWIIRHNLNTENVVMYAFDTEFARITPRAIKVIDANVVEFYFDTAIEGLGVVSKAIRPATSYNPVQWNILHAFNRSEVIIQFREDTTNEVLYPDVVYGDTFDDNFTVVENHPVPSSAFVQRGLVDGNFGLSENLWYFTNESTWVINLYPEISNNFFNVNCYEETTNRRIEPRDIIFETQAEEPVIRIEWDSPVSGFAALNDVGDVVSFYGIIPQGPDGNQLPVDWRLEVQTETDIYTFLQEGSAEAAKFANTNKNVHYGMYVSGTTDSEEQDEDWWYYTFVAKKESLEQLGIKDYDITGVELVNSRIQRTDKQRIIYSRLSGMWKPFGVNFVGHIRIFKDLNGLNVQLRDALGEFLTDSEDDILTA